MNSRPARKTVRNIRLLVPHLRTAGRNTPGHSVRTQLLDTAKTPARHRTQSDTVDTSHNCLLGCILQPEPCEEAASSPDT
eukprot:8659794-Alexandrium_andersonii.AAC.1